MKFVSITAAFLFAAYVTYANAGQNDPYPVLSILRNAGADALLHHKLTEPEKLLFKAIDSETLKLPKMALESAYHEVVVRVGAKYGLSPEQSIAFFARTTLGEFEPDAR